MLKITSNQEQYPKSLNRLHKPPNVLYIKTTDWGELIKRPMLAIVGSRRPSPYGRAVCSEIAKELAKRGVVIVSGLALGTDSIAHKAALDCGGRTIAVLPAGLNKIYPASHVGLATHITDSGGALISTFAPDEKIAFKGNFIARNRIIAGLSKAILIPEAAEGSGSLHTAQFGLEVGAEIMAIPGQINNPISRGSNNLIKSGALMVTKISDVLEFFELGNETSQSYNATNQAEESLLSLISQGVHDGDTLQLSSKLAVEQYNQTITMLEINGQIKPGGGNTWYLS